jgi:dethiobiotin synthetase
VGYFISAIGTDSGKTVVSAIFATALDATYWKPVQAGYPRDADTVAALCDVNIHPEKYILNTPASPHYAAEVDNVHIAVEDFELPDYPQVIVEGAGGLMVPINKQELMADLAAHLNLPVVLVCNLYLGSINHSLLSIDYLKRRQLNVAGIVFNGPPNHSSEEIIEKYCPWPVLLRVPQLENISISDVQYYASLLKQSLAAL